MNFSRIIVQAVLVAAPILWRSFSKAYAQAAARAPEYGRMMSQMNVKRIQPMTVAEAAKVFNLETAEAAKIDYIKTFKTYHKLMKANERSFYLQSKVFRAKEVLDHELRNQGFEFPREVEQMERELKEELKQSEKKKEEKRE